MSDWYGRIAKLPVLGENFGPLAVRRDFAARKWKH
jgi:hypothetical protein